MWPNVAAPEGRNVVALVAFAYLSLTVGLSLWYLTLAAPSLVNDYWWPGFTTSGAQTFLGDYFNAQASLGTNATLLLSSLRVPKRYDTLPTFVEMPPALAREVLLANLSFPVVIEALRANPMAANIRMFTQYCWVDLARAFPMALNARRQAKCAQRYVRNGAVYLEPLLRNTQGSDLFASPYVQTMNATLFAPLAASPDGRAFVARIFQATWASTAAEAAHWAASGLDTWQSQVTNYYEQGLVQTIVIENALGIRQSVTVFAIASQFRGLALWSLVYSYAGIWNDLWTCEALNATMLLGVDPTSDALKADWEFNMDSVATSTPVLDVVHTYLGPLASIDIFLVAKHPTLLAYVAAVQAAVTEIDAAEVPDATIFPVPKGWATPGVVYYTGNPMCFSAAPAAVVQLPMGFYDTCDGPAPLSVELHRRNVLFALHTLPLVAPGTPLEAIAALCQSPPACLAALAPAALLAAQLVPISSAPAAVAAATALNASVYQFAGTLNGSIGFLLQQALVAPGDPWSFFGLVLLYDWLTSSRELYAVEGDAGAITSISRRNPVQQLVANPLELPHQACVYIWYLAVYSSVVLTAVAGLVLAFGWSQRRSLAVADVLHSHRLVGCVWVGRPFLLARGLTALVLLSTSPVTFHADASLHGGHSGFTAAPRSLISAMIVAAEATWITYVIVDFGLPVLHPLGRVQTYAPLSAALAFVAMVALEVAAPYEANVVVAPKCTFSTLGKQVSCVVGRVAIGSSARLLVLLAINVGSVPLAIALQRCAGRVGTAPVTWQAHVLVPACAEVFLSKVHSDRWYADRLTSVLSGMLPVGRDRRLDFKLWRLLSFPGLHGKGPMLDECSVLPYAGGVAVASTPWFRARALSGFLYVLFSIAGSYSYIYVSSVAMANDFWWADFNSSGHQTYLTNWFNSQLQFANRTVPRSLADRRFSDNAYAYNSSSSLASAPLVAYASALQGEANRLPSVIAALRRMNPCDVAWISTLYCFVDFDGTWELGASVRRQAACSSQRMNGAVYLEAVLRNIEDWAGWDACYGDSLHPAVFAYLETSARGQAWLRETLRPREGSVADEVAYWRAAGIVDFETEWQNYKSLGVIEAYAIENAFGVAHFMSLKSCNGSLHTTVQSSFKMHWALANDLWSVSNATVTAGASLVRQSPRFLFANATTETVLLANATLLAPLNPGFASFRVAIGPFGTVSMRRVPAPLDLVAWYQHLSESLAALVTVDAATAAAFGALPGTRTMSPKPEVWLTANFVGGDITCPSMPSAAQGMLFEFFTAAGACILGVSNALYTTNVMFASALLATDLSTPAEWAAACALDSVTAATCKGVFEAVTAFLTVTLPSDERQRMFSDATAVRTLVTASIPVVLVQYMAENASVVLAREPLFSSRAFDFYSWLYLVDWVLGAREVVTFAGDVDSITTISGRNTITTQPVNGMEIPVNVAYYFRCVLIFITAVLGAVAVLVVIYSLTSRGYIEGANLFSVNRVAGLVWVGRPLLLLRGITAVCLLSTATLQLTQVGGFYSFAAPPPSWFTTIMASGEITWIVFILNDTFSLVTREYTARYGIQGSLLVWAVLATGNLVAPVHHSATIDRQCTIVAVDLQLECLSGTVTIGSFSRFVVQIGATAGVVAVVYIAQRLFFPHLKSPRVHSFLLYATAKHHYKTSGWVLDGVYYLDRASAVVTGLLSFEWRGVVYLLDIKTWRQYALNVADERSQCPAAHLAHAIPLKL
ncbi:hypothetical protein ACHHYP_12872 [Achlya hypogyna]|uniref:Uncharacterized protein n=1 Tax=Achlya hypogyna TaxID=1202772 RepID=A0A1V9ZG19_ACHHY|nr:hypothetical protein ACHHYP_12872 [Achlya hypogyna]